MTTVSEKCQEIIAQFHQQGVAVYASAKAELELANQEFMVDENLFKECINWKKLGTGADDLCNKLGLPSYRYHLVIWIIAVVVLYCLFGLFFQKLPMTPKTNLALALLSLVPSLIMAGSLRCWVSNRRARNLSMCLNVTILQLIDENLSAEGQLSFKYRRLLGNADISIGKIQFRKVGKPTCGFAIGLFFGKDQECAGCLVETEGVWKLSTIGHPPRQLQRGAISKKIYPLMAEEPEVIARVERAIGKAERVEATINCPLDMNKVRNAWSTIVLNAAETADLAHSLVAFASGASSTPRGILLKGPPGTGKSMTAQAFAESSGAHFFKLSVADLKAQVIGGSGQNVKKLWDEARAKAPSIIFVDECEGIFAKRGSSQSDNFTNEAVQNFLTNWDGIGKSGRVLVLGATNRAELLDDAILSRFTDVIELLPAEADTRPQLVTAVARQAGITSKIPEKVVRSLGGMSGREMRNVMEKASRLAISDSPTPSHFEEAISKVRRKGSTKVSDDATWERLVLPAALIGRLKTLCEMVRDAEMLTKKGIPVTKTLLLYGPPGTGKTQIARTLANQAGVNFIAFSTADLKGQYLGHAANAVKQAFESARASSPCIVFIDEIDALTASRDGGVDNLQKEALVQLLQELDGIASKSGYLLVIAATNLPDQIDSAIMSRFSQRLEIGLPTTTERVNLLENELKGRPVKLTMGMEQLAALCEGYSGRQLRELVAEAFSIAVQRVLDSGRTAHDTELTDADMEMAIKGALL